MLRALATSTMAAGGLVALGFAVYVYITPLSGSTGSVGPLLTAAGGAAIALGALLLSNLGWGVWRVILALVVVVTLSATAAAGYFLLQPVIVAAVAVAALGFLASLVITPEPR